MSRKYRKKCTKECVADKCRRKGVERKRRHPNVGKKVVGKSVYEKSVGEKCRNEK